ncbi:SLC13 family permease [Endothiovibrio diazotrophicus]
MSETIALTPEMIWVLVILGTAVVLFVTEAVSVDVTALCVLVALGLADTAAPYLDMEPLLTHKQLLSGFSSNAVVSVIAVMIIGAGLDKTGMMNQVAGILLKIGGRSEKKLRGLVAVAVGFISSFMQNVGAAALLMPAVSRISARTGIPLSRLLMPLGFCAILGGTVTMIGTSPLILLNDLIQVSNQSLPASMQMAHFGLFDVTPVGLSLLVAGILYFALFGHLVLPAGHSDQHHENPESTMHYFRDLYDVEGDIFELEIPYDSPLVGLTVGEAEYRPEVPIFLGLEISGGAQLAPCRDEVIEGHSVIAVLGPEEEVRHFAEQYGLVLLAELDRFVSHLNPTRSGIAEVLIPPGSFLIGHQLGDLYMRKSYGLNVMSAYRSLRPVPGAVSEIILEAGDTLLVHTTWKDLATVADDRNFVVITDYPQEEEIRPHKVRHAVFFFVLALGLALTGLVKLPIALLTGALGMILSGVLNVDEAYQSVSWRTVFLLAGLIPMGLAMESSGTAAWIAQAGLHLLDGVPAWGLQLAVALLSTAFALVMSNVGATVLLVPLAVNIAVGSGADPAMFALTVGVATSNAFIIPTHQVNALILGPGGYRVADFLRAGGIMTVLFLVVTLVALNLFY